MLLSITRGEVYALVCVNSKETVIWEQFDNVFLVSCKIIQKRDAIVVN